MNREIRVTTILEENPDLDLITLTDAKSLRLLVSTMQHVILNLLGSGNQAHTLF